MKVETVYINCYKYDFDFAKICISSIRYWYPDIPIFLIKDTGSAGNFDTSNVEKIWSVKVFDTNRKRFGWGFGKWEPLFSMDSSSFLTLDADTVITGPILDEVISDKSQFIVDEEIQPFDRMNEIYYKLDRIHEVNSQFQYPGYSFNEGQWFGTSGILSREDFDPILIWTEPPTAKFPCIIKQGAQGHLNYMLQLKQQQGMVSLTRKRIMIWPSSGNADFIDVSEIYNKSKKYPYIIHWAGFPYKNYCELPRYDILSFYLNYYYTKISRTQRIKDKISRFFLIKEKKIKKTLNRFVSRLKVNP